MFWLVLITAYALDAVSGRSNASEAIAIVALWAAMNPELWKRAA